MWLLYLVGSLISMLLVNRAGRRVLLISSNSLIMCALTSFTVCVAVSDAGGAQWTVYGGLASMFVYIGSFSIGPSSIPWILPQEMFTQETRGMAATIISSVAWGVALVTTLLFPVLQGALKVYTFLIFVGLLAVATLHSFFMLPETKGKTIDEIQRILRKRIYCQN